MTTETLTVAETIFDQIAGGRRGRFCAMTGAKDFTATATGLRFRLPSTPHFVKDGINIVKIDLMPTDTYTVTFFKARGSRCAELKQIEGVYCDNLRRVFESETGLTLSL